MRNRLVLPGLTRAVATGALCLVLWACACNPSEASTNQQHSVDSSSYVPNQVIIKYRSPAPDSLRQVYSARLAWHSVRKLPLIGAELVQLQTGSVAEVLGTLHSDPNILYAEPNFIVSAQTIPDDPQFPLLWGLHNTGQSSGIVDADIDAPEAWDLHTTSDVIVGVLDTGIDSAHVDLRTNIWHNPGEIPGNGTDDDGNGYIDDVYGWDFVNNDNDPFDDHSHGTHVSGTIGAVGDNGEGVVGVTWQAQLMALKFLDEDGYGSTADAVLALEYAIAMGVRLTNNSWGGGEYSQALSDAIDSARAHGMLVLAAAGNVQIDIDAIPFYPASYAQDNLITVAATNSNDRLADEVTWGSNWGATSVDLAAPGVNIYSTEPGDLYGFKSGTSMATPHVCGAAALLWSAHPHLSWQQIQARLLLAVDPLPTLAGRCVTGGRLNIGRAISEPDSTPPAPVTDLQVIGVEGSRVTLTWTATGDDLNVGQAWQYDLRYSLAPIDSANFLQATRVAELPRPRPAGQPDTAVVTDLEFTTTFYFALKVMDDWSDTSGISNVIAATTVGPPVASLRPESLFVQIAAGESADLQFELTNAGPGELIYEIREEYAFESPGPGRVLAELATPAAADVEVLLLYADNGAQVVREMLETHPRVNRVDTLNAAAFLGEVPPLDSLLAYDLVIAWNNRAWANRWFIGEVLADYKDAGGAVVTLVDCWGSGKFASFGRFFSDPGYSPFRSIDSALFFPRTLGWYNTAHPLMTNVGDLATGSYYNQVELTEGAVIVARWDDGTPLVATLNGSVAINIWPGDGYHWLGDVPVLMHNAVSYAVGQSDWLVLRSVAGEIAPGGDSTLLLSIDGSHLVAGSHTGTVAVHSNDPTNPRLQVSIGVQVSGNPELVLAEDTLIVGPGYVGFPDTTLIRIDNPGTDTLRIVVDSLSGEAFTTTGATDVPPREHRLLSVVYDPAGSGTHWSELFLSTNDPLYPTALVQLIGFSKYPPIADFSASMDHSDLFTGQVRDRPIVLRNPGGDSLRFSLWEKDLPTAGFAPAAAEPYRVLSWTRYTDTSPGMEYEQTRLAIESFVSSVVFEETRAADSGLLRILLADQDVMLLPEQENALPEIAAIAAEFGPVLHDFVSRGGVLISCLEWGPSDGFLGHAGLLDVTPLQRQLEEPLRLVLPDHPLVDSVPSVFLGLSFTGWYDVHTPDAQIVVSDTFQTSNAVVINRDVGAGHVVLLGFDYFKFSPEMALILANAVRMSRAHVPWLSVSPAQGEIAPGDSALLSVTHSAYARPGGDYAALLELVSNDPATPRLGLPATMRITDAADIQLSQQSVNFGGAFVGGTGRDTIVVTNYGTLPLHISEVTATPEMFSTSLSTLSIAPGDTQSILVFFAPLDTAVRAGEVTLTTSDPDESLVIIPLTGVGTPPPVIEVAPDSLQAELVIAERATRQLTIANSGVAALTFDIAFEAVSATSRREPGDPAVGMAATRAPPPTTSTVVRPWHAGLSPGWPLQETVRSTRAAATSVEQTLLLLYAGSPPDSLATLLSVQEGIARVDLFDASYSIPNVLAVLEYDAIIVLNSDPFAEADLLGDLLAYYVDAGGGVVQTLASFALDYEIGGRFKSELYSAFASGTGPVGSAALGWYNTSHPVMDGVESLEGDALADVTLATDAFLIAEWNTGRPLAASRRSRVVALNLYLSVSGFWRGDAARLVRNAAAWVGSGVRWLSADPASGSVAPGSALVVTVTIDATALYDGRHEAHVLVASNDPVHPISRVTVTSQVSGGVPRLVVDPHQIDFGDVFVGHPREWPLIIRNAGTSTLHIHGIRTEPAELQLQVQQLDLAPARDTTIRLTLLPATPGDIAGHVTLLCDDPVNDSLVVEVRAEADYAPHLTASSAAQVIEVADELTRSHDITIANDGQGPMTWWLADTYIHKPVPVLLAAMAPYLPAVDPDAGTDNRRVAMPVATENVEVTATLADLTGKRVGFANSSIYQTLQADLDARGADTRDVAFPMSPGRWRIFDAIAVDDALMLSTQEDVDSLRSWLSQGHGLLVQADNEATMPLLQTLLDGTGITVVAASLDHGIWTDLHPHVITRDVKSVNASSYTAYLTLTDQARAIVTDDSGRVHAAVSHLGAGRIVVVANEVSGDFNLYTTGTRLFSNQVMDWLALTDVRLTAGPSRGDLAPGAQESVRLVADASAFDTGWHEVQIVFDYNNPDATSVVVDLDLLVFVVQAGDATADHFIDTKDIIHLVNFLWKEGPDPYPGSGDADCDGSTTINDIIYLVNYTFKGGPQPDCSTP